MAAEVPSGHGHARESERRPRRRGCSDLRKHAAEAHVSEGEILDRALRAYDLRALLARLQAQSDLDDDQAMALAREELKAVRAARRAAG